MPPKALLGSLVFAGCLLLAREAPAKQTDTPAADAYSLAYESWQKAIDYATKVSDQMLSDLHEDAWGSAIRLTCGGPAPAPKGGGLEQWVQLHFDTSDEAAKAFGYNREGVERLDLIDTATRETAQKQVYAVLRPTWFAYQRAKHKHALHLLSIARAGGHERAFCGTKAR